VNQFSQKFLEQVRQVVSQVPQPALESIIRLLETESGQSDYSMLSNRLRQLLPNANWWQVTANLINLWQAEAKYLEGGAIALALATAAHCQTSSRQELSTELVWTGPNPDSLPLRRTEQALLQLIRAAQHELLIVSFAIYNIPEIVEALFAAMKRGVRVRIIAETPESSEGKISYGIHSTFGAEILKQAEVFIWPKEKRILDGQGRHGSLHAKCAASDGQHLFISSANLTEYAMSLNMEMGILVHSRKAVSQVIEQIDSLILNRYLVLI
jgi:phosphatidylserine/phosphatidylglycerophosphate/cardiolipin synthase-like enzyme